MAHINKLNIPIILVLFLLFIVSCVSEQNDAGNTAAISKKYDQPPISLTLTASEQSITVAQRLELTLSAQMPEDYAVSFPDYPEEENSFLQNKTSFAKPRLSKDGTVVRAKMYALEPFLPGSYKIPPLTVKFITPDKKETTIITDEMTIEVTSLLDQNEQNPDIEDLAPVVEQPRGRNFYIMIALFILLLAAGGYLLIKYLRKRNIKPPPPPIPPHELAMRELDKLISSNLIERGEIKIFHQQVSDILRHYIENRFTLRAPERTTEEFLAELGTTNALQADHKSMLHDFLTHCDLVKFAEHIPARDETMQTVELCRIFIKQTRPQKNTEVQK